VVVVAVGEPGSPVTCWPLAGRAQTNPSARLKAMKRDFVFTFDFVSFA
jgi:hypothetical protein